MTILIDCDDVLEDLTVKWVKYLDAQYGTGVAYEDITQWDMTKNFPMLTRDQIYGAETDEELYASLEPLPGAVDYVKRFLEEGHRVYVVTNSPYGAVKPKMERFLLRYYPFLSWKNVIITSNKAMIKGDVLIDDGPHNLTGGEYRKILLTAPYNKDFEAEKYGIQRASNWDEIYEAVQRIAGEREDGF